MLLTTLYLRLILIYHCLPPAIAIDRLRCFAEYAPIRDFRSCADAMGSIPYNKPESPFFRYISLSTTLRPDNRIVERQRPPEGEIALFTLEFMRDFVWPKVEMVARDIVELCSKYGSLKGRGAGTMDSGIYLRVSWYPFHAIVRGADTAYIKGEAVAHIDGSPYKVSPPPMCDGSAHPSRT